MKSALTWVLISVTITIISTAQAEQVSVTATADTYITVHSFLGGSASIHGTDLEMWTIGASTFHARPHIAFDLTSFDGELVAGESATLQMYLRHELGASIPNTISVHPSLVGWSELSNWNDLSGGSVGPSLDFSVVNAGDLLQYVSWQIPASLVQQWIDDPASNLGLVARSQTTVNGADKVFDSREADFPPRLVFEIETCPWDIDGTGNVTDTDDMAVLIAAWGPNPGHPADFDGDGIVGIVDFLELLANWGACP